MSEKITHQNSFPFSALDIGSTKVIFMIASSSSLQNIQVLGIGSSPNFGTRDGVIVNFEGLVESIQEAYQEARRTAGINSSPLWLSFGGPSTHSFDSSGMTALYNKEVTDFDKEKAIEMAKAISIPMDRKILHVLTQDYKVDYQSGISDPRGMSGMRLEASVHIVTAHFQNLQNHLRCVEKAGLETKNVVLRQYASSFSTLEEEEKNMGVSLIDIGGEFSDMITFYRGSVIQTATFPIGGNHFTKDIMMTFGCSQSSAEQLKHKHACALSDMISEEEVIKMENLSKNTKDRRKKTVKIKKICQLMEARVKEMFRFIRKEVDKCEGPNFKRLNAGIVLTGGGSQIKGLIEAGSLFSHLPIRRADPHYLETKAENGKLPVRKESSDPSLSTAYGLLLYGLRQESKRQDSFKRTLNTKRQYKWNQFFKNAWEKAFPQSTT